MNLFEIRIRASKENVEVEDVEKWTLSIQNMGELYPKGVDFVCPEQLIPRIEAICDIHKIPFHHLVKNTCSTARTYTALTTHEGGR